MSSSDYEIIKKGHTKDSYTQTQLQELMHSTADPIFFVERFIKVQHPTKGSIPLKLYDFQKHMITGFNENRFVVGLTARQMGKSNFYTTIINTNNGEMMIGDLIQSQLTLKERLVVWLERKLLELVISVKNE